MKEFMEEFLYMCSSSNTKSRGFYLFLAATLVILLIGSIVSLILLIVNIAKGFFNPLFLVLTIVMIAILIGIIIWLKKS